jgi:hypothetical protein
MQFCLIVYLEEIVGDFHFHGEWDDLFARSR